MKLKTYVARDLKEALAQVKKELGPEAVILSTQSRLRPENGSDQGGRLGVEVTAAVDVDLAAGGDQQVEAFWPDTARPGPSIQQIQEDLDEVKALLRQWLHFNGPPSWLLQHKELAILYRVLTRTGLDERLLVHWLENVQTLLAQGEKQPHSLRQRAFRYLMNAITVLDPWESVPGRPRPRLWTLVGPTGVGKTTTISKLAAQQALVDKRRVGLISLDNQRLGAHDQLAAFSRISGLPFIVAHTRSDLVDAIQKMLDLELVLIDTPGRSPHSPSLGLELQQMLGGLPDLEHHLALSATVQESNLAAAIQGFSVLPITSYIITKVDESLDFSGVFNQVCHHRVPISYLTTGQRVPEDLELATRQRVTELLLRRCQGRPSGGRTRKKYDQIHPA